MQNLFLKVNVRSRSLLSLLSLSLAGCVTLPGALELASLSESREVAQLRAEAEQAKRNIGRAGSNLPACDGVMSAWTNCIGSNVYPAGEYVGEFQNGLPDGYGTTYFLFAAAGNNRGDKYVGEFKNGLLHGQGTYYHLADNKNKGDKHVGEYRYDKRNGQGTYYYLADNNNRGDKYVGEFKNGNIQGQGTHYLLADNKYRGDKYVGEFENSKRQGQGTYYFLADNPRKGFKFVGEFENGLRQGRGIMFTPDGDVQESGIYSSAGIVRSEAVDPAIFSRIKQEADAQIAAVQAIENDRLKAEAEEAQLAAAQQQAQLKPTAPVGPRLSVHAIVIGNGAYQGSGRLDNPINDARAMSAKLRQMGFKVTTIENATRSKLVSALVGFNRSASATDVSMFFYAGHAAQISGINYMLPTDINMNDLSEVPLHGISLNSVIDQYLPGKTKLVFLDACRDNPLLQVASRSMTRGLAPISVSEGVMIAYATKDGSVAADGNGKNSPFTKALLQHIDGPDDISVVLRKVRAEVMQDTDGKQQPWDYNSLTGGSLILSAIRAK